MQKPFPFVPFGQIVIIKVLSSGRTRKGIYLPEGSKGEGGAADPQITVAEVIATPADRISEFTGKSLPWDCVPGDIILLAAKQANKIPFSLRDELLDRGLTEQELETLMITNAGMIMGKVVGDRVNVQEPVQEAKEPTRLEKALVS